MMIKTRTMVASAREIERGTMELSEMIEPFCVLIGYRLPLYVSSWIQRLRSIDYTVGKLYSS